ncbi:putative HTH-type transcriptional regulator [Halomonadaceae bacterium LMG 33818]|uniref:LysR family transcriptional regulator ArgP n=1 Tax=Cernens ardua TaxID=3402176 RepID=UPI003EDC0A9F
MAIDLLHPQLSAFIAVIEEGSFDAAALRLSVTPSAISQRIKALEDRLGQPLIVRQTPAQPTSAGSRLLRQVRQMQAIEEEASQEFVTTNNASPFTRPVSIALNDDSLQTWILPVLGELHRRRGMLFDIRMDDQAHTLEMIRNGTVLGAISSEAKPLQGCRSISLGAMRYVAIASPAFQRKYFSEGLNAATLSHAPMLEFGRKDELQIDFIERMTQHALSPPTQYLPTAIGFVEAAIQGLGWGLVPDIMATEALKTGSIIDIAPHTHLEVPLYWQVVRVSSSTLDELTRALVNAASKVLH